MQVLDRYLAAVARNLPKAQAADITAELRDNLLSEIEEKEADLGRKLNAKELDALLIGFGHPLKVAARYRKTRYLIGPEIYPFWVATLRVVFGIIAVLLAVGLVIRIAAGDASSERIAVGLAGIWPVAFTAFGVVTLVFAIMEWAGKGRMRMAWSPRQLPPPRTPGRKPIQIVSEMVAGAVAILWWTGVVQFAALIPIPTFVHIHLAHVWTGLFWPILAYWSVEVAINGLELARPGWTRLNAGLSAAKNLAGCVILVRLLQAGHWIDVNARVSPFALDQMRHGFDRGMQVGMTVTLLVLAAKAVWDLWRLVGPRPRGVGDIGGAAGTPRPV